jgi:hypothetical protein
MPTGIEPIATVRDVKDYQRAIELWVISRENHGAKAKEVLTSLYDICNGSKFFSGAHKDLLEPLLRELTGAYSDLRSSHYCARQEFIGRARKEIGEFTGASFSAGVDRLIVRAEESRTHNDFPSYVKSGDLKKLLSDWINDIDEYGKSDDVTKSALFSTIRERIADVFNRVLTPDWGRTALEAALTKFVSYPDEGLEWQRTVLALFDMRRSAEIGVLSHDRVFVSIGDLIDLGFPEGPFKRAIGLGELRAFREGDVMKFRVEDLARFVATRPAYAQPFAPFLPKVA